MGITVRSARANEGPAVVELIRGLAAFERLPGPDDDAARRFLRDLADPERRFHVLVAEGATGLLGYALYFLTYSTFRARPKLFLEDLFVVPAARREGVGRALVIACARDALRLRCAQMEWAVLHWNEPAKSFYRSLGAATDLTWEPFGLDETILSTLAAAQPDGPIVEEPP
jgi:GNAT superfamily N-acetyltransferase